MTAPPLDRPAQVRRPVGVRSTIVAVLLAFAGLGVMLYPSTASWFADLDQRERLHSYSQEIERTDPAELEARRQAAHAYNDRLVGGALRDPFTTAAGPLDDATRAYLGEITAEPGGILAELRIPGVAELLPVYHGTAADTLEKGVGHLYGSSLPVGGPGTHAVLTGHRGYPQATMFSGLDRLGVGDTFTLTTLGQTLTYQVTRTTVVEPDQTHSLAIVPGKDLVTLVTCTPVGVNSHRILVQAERVPDAQAPHALSPAPGPGFPWWIAAWVVAVAAGSGVVVQRHRRDRVAEEAK